MGIVGERPGVLVGQNSLAGNGGKVFPLTLVRHFDKQCSRYMVRKGLRGHGQIQASGS